MIDYNGLRKINEEQLKRFDLGATLRFDDAIPSILKIKKLLLSFEGKELELIDNERQPIINIFNRLSEHVRQILEFQSVDDENIEASKRRKEEIIRVIKTLLVESNEKILSLSINLNSNDKQINQVVIDAQNKVIDANNKLQGFDNLFNTKNSEFDKRIAEADKLILEARQTKNDIQNSSIDSVVSKYGTIFEDQASSNRKVAMWSLGIFVLSIIALLAAAYYLFNPILEGIKQIIDPNTRIEYIIVQSVFRVILLGISFVFAKESLKSYNINMHLYNLNRHRQNSLKSFETLISATQTLEIRDHIIKEIAQTIYSNQEDGYLQADKKKISISEIAELIKALR